MIFLRDEMEQIKISVSNSWLHYCVGYGPGIPFAAFSKQEQPETILDGQEINDQKRSSSRETKDMSPRLCQKKVFIPFFIKMDRQVWERGPGQRLC